MKSEIIKSFVKSKNELYSNLKEYYQKFLEDYLKGKNLFLII